MNKHQEHHHGLHHQDQSEDHAQIEMSDATITGIDDRELMSPDELEKKMFERAR